MSDDKGNDVNLVGIPVTGAIALAPEGSVGPTPVEGAAENYVLPAGFRRIGLVTQDGGPEFTEERDGDPIQFWQDGYSIPTGLANCTLTFTAAETNPLVQELHAGKEPDENGYVEINAGGHAKRYVLWLEEIFRNGMIRRRIAYTVTVDSFTAVKSERGTVMGYTIVLRIGVSSRLGNNHYGQWVLNPSATPETPAPTVTAVEPTTGDVGDTVTLTGTNLDTIHGVRFGSVTAPEFSATSPTTATVTVPSVAAGATAVRVVRDGIASAPVTFTVTA